MASRGKMILNLALQNVHRDQEVNVLRLDDQLSHKSSEDEIFDDDVRDKTWMPKRKDMISSDSDDSLYTYSVKLEARKKMMKKKNKKKATLKEDNPTIHIDVIDHEETIEADIPNDTAEPVNEREFNEQNSDINNNSETSNNINEQNKETQPKPRAKRGFGNPDDWQLNINKKQRMLGKQYMGRKNVDGKNKFSNAKPERVLSERCCTTQCEKWKKSRQCSMVSDTTRKEVFNSFWSDMNWSQKKVYVCSLVEKQETTNTTVEAERNSRRKFSYVYYIRQGDVKLQVCKRLFLSTLGIGERMMYNWVEDTDHGIPHDKGNRKARDIEARVGVTEGRDFARNFLEDLPKLPSHYCRKSSSKMYLEPVFSTFVELHNVYKEHCRENDKSPISKRLLLNLFNELNLSLYHPKKDKCDLCCEHETQNISEDIYLKHIEQKERAREEKAKDKNTCLENNEIKVLTMDLQAVMICPRVNASALYYKTKLSCHNFTTFDLGTTDVNCYFWHEGEGGLTADSFASCIADTVTNIVHNNPTVKEIVLYSDGCGYQNRNATLSNALLLLSLKHNITITQKFLVKGHTQMEVDSVHSTIERVLKRKDIYSPHNYVHYISAARSSRPYSIRYLEHGFFKAYSLLKYFDNIRPGNKVGDPCVNDIRVLQYTPTSDILYKLSFDDEFQVLPKRRNHVFPRVDDVVEPLYNSPLQIKKTKYDHLQQLKSVIPKDYHSFYDALLYMA